MCVCLCVYIYIYIYMYVCVCMYVCIHMYTYIHIYIYICIHLSLSLYIYIYIYIHIYIYIYIYIYTDCHPSRASASWTPWRSTARCSRSRRTTARWRRQVRAYGRFPKFHRVFVGPRPWHIEMRHRVKKHPQLICSDLRLSNCKFEDLNYGNRPYK